MLQMNMQDNELNNDGENHKSKEINNTNKREIILKSDEEIKKKDASKFGNKSDTSLITVSHTSRGRSERDLKNNEISDGSRASSALKKEKISSEEVARLLTHLAGSLKEMHVQDVSKDEKEVQTSSYIENSLKNEVLDSDKLEELFQENLHLGNVVKVLEEDISRLRYENHKLEKALKKAQENLAQNGKVLKRINKQLNSFPIEEKGFNTV